MKKVTMQQRISRMNKVIEQRAIQNATAHAAKAVNELLQLQSKNDDVVNAIFHLQETLKQLRGL